MAIARISGNQKLTAPKGSQPNVGGGVGLPEVEKTMINWSRIEELQSEIGADGFAEVVDLFLDEVEGIVMRLKARPEPAQYEADLHFLKGGAWNLGFADFGALCQDGERRAAAGNAAEIDISCVIDSYFASKDAFMSGLASRGIASSSAA